MKNIILLALLINVNLKSDCYSLLILSKNIENQYLKVNIKNKSKKTLIFYNGDYQSNFKIVDDNDKENVGEVTSIYSGEDYLDYQFDYSKNLIDKVMKKYSLSFRDAVLYLHYKDKYILIPPNDARDIDLPIINKNYTTKYKLDSTKAYFMNISASFSTEYIPQYVRDSLNSKNFEIINPKIETDKININIDKFFRKHKNFYIK
ncbi:hypothetical protein [uncultured Chryseobacterium sp.]|uniref:hypothetical protein n=1 Tax=uncultured Chryseobacterium sp. TaxID=259322 RepID=UPI0025E34668|nr:hypothetical protein [uncultured Chryseobacterium sp.]